MAAQSLMCILFCSSSEDEKGRGVSLGRREYVLSMISSSFISVDLL